MQAKMDYTYNAPPTGDVRTALCIGFFLINHIISYRNNISGARTSLTTNSSMMKTKTKTTMMTKCAVTLCALFLPLNICVDSPSRLTPWASVFLTNNVLLLSCALE